jgi:hypothetical protein
MSMPIVMNIGVSIGARAHRSKYRVRIAVGIIVVLVVFFATLIGLQLHREPERAVHEEQERVKNILTYSACERAGYPVERGVCTLPDGRELEKFEVRVPSP